MSTRFVNTRDRASTRRLMRAGFIGALLSAGFATGVTLVKKTSNGGIVAYPFKDERGGPMSLPDCPPALELMQAKCPRGYRVIREAADRGCGNVSGLQEGMEGEPLGRRLGISSRASDLRWNDAIVLHASGCNALRVTMSPQFETMQMRAW